jgi:hypothetical protein
VTEEIRQILEIEQRVLLRRRALALQDSLALCILAAGAVAGALALGIRLGLIPSHTVDSLAPRTWPQTLIVFGAAAVTLFAIWFVRAWFLRRGSSSRFQVNRPALPGTGLRGGFKPDGDDPGRALALLIDNALNLDDRFATSHAIIKGGRPHTIIESAVIDDTATRLGNARASAVVPYRAPRLGVALRSPAAVTLAALMALGSGILVFERNRSVSVPAAADIAAAAAIETAGDRLAQSSEQVAESLAAEGVESNTAKLAREQSELGRTLRQQSRAGTSNAASKIPGRSQSEALKALSSLEERIQARHSELADTHAAEIVTLAERRLGDAVATAKPRKPATPEPQNRPLSASSPNKEAKEAEKAEPSAEAENASPAQTAPPEQDKKNPDPPSAESSRPSTNEQDPKQPGRQAEPNPLAEQIAGQAARLNPDLSAQLLKKAAELRADKLTAQDIERFKQAAQAFAKDLPKIANSPEFQRAVEQLARQVSPEQIEAVAKQLMANEKLRDELKAAARLLAENQEAKAMISGLGSQLQGMRQRLSEQGLDEKLRRVQQDLGAGRGGPASGATGRSWGNGQQGLRGPLAAQPGNRNTLSGSGPNQRASGSVTRQGSLQDAGHDDPLYLRTRPGAAPVRVPYSAAYPQYRRQAEASVERSQVPRRLRSLVRNYFDAINPDGRK